ncbi:MAG: DUF3551 domain-containing protein [Pseudolabrys sp.]|jgi:hypothetical protein
MKFGYMLSAFAAVLLLTGGVMVQPATAATSGHNAWCMRAPSMGKMSCRYKTLAACQKFEKAENGSCVRNPNLAKRKTRSTTGMH